MLTAYICSPYRAKDKQELKRNKEYAKLLTRTALDCGIAPIALHLYITKVTNEDNPDDRRSGMAAGLELLHKCDVVIVGSKYGVSEGMAAEIKEAKGCGIKIVEYEIHQSVEELVNAAYTAARARYARYF